VEALFFFMEAASAGSFWADISK